MQPRRLRLGDVVDDYCSRCRLLSNHAIAAIVDDVIKQTRCSTCDFEHPYKDGKLPARRTRNATSALYKQVLDNVTEGTADEAAAPSRLAGPRPVLARTDAPRPALVSPDPQPTPDPAPAAAPPPAAARPAPIAAPPALRSAPAPAPMPVAAAPSGPEAPPADRPAEDREPAHEAIVHRRLIRATLPRVEGAEREPRPIPTFTVHEAANARPNKFRRFRPAGQGHGHGHGNFNGNFTGNGNFNGNARFGHGGQPSPFGAHPGRGHGKGGPNRGGNQQHGNRANQQQRRGNKGR
jgi:hypothetical protein